MILDKWYDLDRCRELGKMVMVKRASCAILAASLYLSLCALPVLGTELTGTLNLADMGVTWEGVTFTGIDANDFSFRISNAGDINGDGIDDVLIGANQADPNGIDDAGETYLVYGRSGASALSGTFDLANADVTFNGIGPENNDFSGTTVSNAGDVNGDGIDDLLIGAFGADPSGNSSAGETYLVYGRSGASALSGAFDLANADVTFNGINAGDWSGNKVSNAGDVNGDGIDDILIGAVLASPNGDTEAGESYLIYGKSGAGALSGTFDLANADVTFQGINSGDNAATVQNAGDINGDGIDDLLVATIRPDPNGNNDAGETYLVYGKSGAGALSGTFDLANADVIFQGLDADDFSGWSISNAGDVNGDGIDDLLIGAVGGDPNGNNNAGETYLVYGRNGAGALSGIFDLANADVIFQGIDEEDNAGNSVSNAGDVNGDGIDDILIAAHHADPSGIDLAGETYLIYGRSGAGALSGTFNLSDADAIFNGIDASDQSGAPISNAGDVNGDGFDDFLIGSFRAEVNGNIQAGESYLVYGNNLLVPEPGTLALVGIGVAGLATRIRRGKSCN